MVTFCKASLKFIWRGFPPNRDARGEGQSALHLAAHNGRFEVGVKGGVFEEKLH